MKRCGDRRTSLPVMVALLVGVLVVGPNAAGQEPALESSSFKASADSYIDRAAPEKNHGRARTLRSGGTKTTFIKVPALQVPGSIVNATLRLHIASGSGRHTVRAVPENNWTERNLKAANAPKLGPPLGSFVAIRGRRVSIDVTRWITQTGVYGFAVSSKRGRAAVSSRNTSRGPRLEVQSDPAAQDSPRVFAHYYLRWSDRHWRDQLGPNYPYGQNPLPLPATVAANGCGATTNYEGNRLLDVPASLYTQDTPGVIEEHVRAAAAAGISGFAVTWHGTGASDQTSDDLSYSRRLAELVRAVNEVNVQGIGFKLWINYRASEDPSPIQPVINDLTFLSKRYGTNNAMDHRYSNDPLLVWGGSQYYTLADVASVSTRFRSSFFLVGDESWTTWGDGRGAHFDGAHYFWPTQNPDTNPESFDQLRNLAEQVRSSGSTADGSPKRWFAPFTPGYNSELLGRETGTCVPRDDGQTMRELFQGNSQSAPDDWLLISWNGITDNTHVEPLQRWGDTYLRLVDELINQ